MTPDEVLALDGNPPDSEFAHGDLDDRRADQEQSRWERDVTKEW